MDAIIIQLEDGPQYLVDQLLSNQDEKIDYQAKSRFIPLTPTSIVIDDISIETTLNEIEEICKAASDKLLSIAQPDPYYIEEGILRRKVLAIYSHDVDIREVCWRLSRMRLSNRPLNVHINKCLTNRILSVDPAANHHHCIVNDIRNAIILILNLDELKGLYGKRKQVLESVRQEAEDSAGVDVKMEDPLGDNNPDGLTSVAPLSPPGSDRSANEDEEDKPFDVSSLDEDKEKEKKKLFEFKFNVEPSLYRIVSKLNKSKNSLLQKAPLYLVEYTESSSKEYFLSKVPKELHHASVACESSTDSEAEKYALVDIITRNLPCTVEESARYLDRLLWYLRIVHSFDFYKKALYRLEDELTLKFGVIHLRKGWTESMEPPNIDEIKEYIRKADADFLEFGQSQSQKFVSKDEERFNYKSYGKVITDELTSYAQRIQRPKSSETEEVYKCRHCTRVFQKLSDIGRHFVSKHRWAIDAIELETDFFNAYLFDSAKINPCPPKELLEVPPNRFARLTNFSQMGEDPDLLQQTLEAYSKMESFVREPAPRSQIENDPRNETMVDYTDISFDDAI